MILIESWLRRMNAIEEAQNEKRMLQYQNAARWYYNRAEILNNLVWGCCILSWLTIFLPDSPTWKILFISIPFSINIIAFILNRRLSANVLWAATLRKYFDAYVLGIDIYQFTRDEVLKLEEISFKVIKRYPKKSKEQMTNTGHDDPPGVRNWYEFSQPLSVLDAIYECQKQNCWWNKKLTRLRIIRSGIELLILITVAIIIFVWIKADILLVILSSSGLVLKCIERAIANTRYYILSLKIDGALDILENSRSEENIKCLQAKIDIRRAMPVLEKHRIHKRHAKDYSELYHGTTDNIDN